LRTLGIDLASQPRLTASCAVDWSPDGAVVQAPHLNLDDDALVSEIERADFTGIDAPFGFPEPFADAVATWRTGGSWPTEEVRALRFRQTDFAVHELTGRWPLSVSSDLIALPAWRCARLLTRLGITARDGSQSVFEVYPGAALSAWRFERAGYRMDADVRARLIVSLVDRSQGWLDLDEGVRAACVATDHALDALVAAFVARAAATGCTVRPSDGELSQARIEGWIHLPLADSFATLIHQA
jgi:predicted nuclease with RNAse H fold